MATLTNEQIEQKKQLIAEKVKQMKVIYDELVEAGAIELSEDELDGVAGGGKFLDALKQIGQDFVDFFKKETWDKTIESYRYVTHKH